MLGVCHKKLDPRLHSVQCVSVGRLRDLVVALAVKFMPLAVESSFSFYNLVTVMLLRCNTGPFSGFGCTWC